MTQPELTERSGSEAFLIREIDKLRKEQNAVILAHYYQLPEIQQIADFVGDSLQLAQQAAQTAAEVIVLCGVHFMAESAALLCPDRTVLIPAMEAGCPMADMVEPASLRAFREKNPGALVVCYINSSAAVKAESDICCTSANAVQVIASLPPEKPLLFIPDKNLGQWAQSKTGRKMIFWEGYCPVHHALTAAEVKRLKVAHPQALVLVHPECRPEVTASADEVFSTAGIIRYVDKSAATDFIIGTEEGILFQLQKKHPEKKFYLPATGLYCGDMKKINLENLLRALQTLSPRVVVPEEIAEAANRALHRMLALEPF